jgi:hypothetical protein
MSELLLELFSEEIPARMQARAAADFARLLGDKLAAAGLEFKEIRSYATPRRLTAVVDGLPARSPDIREERKGPRVDAPDAAIKGFLKSVGLASAASAEKRDDKKGAYYVALIEKPGRATPEVIAEIVPEIVLSFSWPKSMRWGSGRLRWVRPLHSVLCLFDGKVVDFDIDGIKSGNATRGHRFMAPEPFSVKSFADYVQKLREAKVILDGGERAQLIADQARGLAKKHALTLVDDEALLAENAGLTEWPVALMGAFDEAFLSVPQEVLTTSMKAHQKCFSVRKTGGDLANRFILIANIKAEDRGEAIIAGNDRVIAARLSDAKFFFDQDRKIMLPDRVPKLKEIVFHEKLGTQYDRIQRVRMLAREIAALVGADPDLAERAAILAHNITVRQAALADGLVWEHYHSDWSVDWDYNRDDKTNIFRPWGYQPGHLTEWAKLLLILERHRAQLPGDGNWLLPRAVELFDAALAQAWDDEFGGIFYGFAPDGSICDSDKYFWVQAESLAAAALLAQRTQQAKYWSWYDRIWDYCWRHFVDHRYGAWYRILTRDNRKYSDEKSPAGKTDYHTMGACYEVLNVVLD